MVELQIAILPFVILFFVAAAGIAWVVYRDARNRGLSDFFGTLWAIGAFILAPVTIPLYLLLVARTRKRDRPLQSRELWIIWLFCSLFVPLAGGALVFPPDPFTQLSTQVLLVPIFAVLFYLVIFRVQPRRLFPTLAE